MANDPAFDAIAGIVGDIVKGGIWVTWMGTSALYNALKTPVVVQLQRLTPKEVWGAKIEGVTCPSCKAINERGATRCFACGQGFQ